MTHITDTTATATDTTGQTLQGRPGLSEPARQLLRAADKLFYAQGAPATTVRQITAACGLTPGALYNHFSSKDELLYTLVRNRHIRIEMDCASAQADVAGDPVAEFTAIIGVYFRAHVGNRQGTLVANREYRHLSPPRMAEVVAIRRRLRDRLVAVLDAGGRQEAFHVLGASEPGAIAITASTILDICVHSSQWLHKDGAMGLDQLEALFTGLALRLAGHHKGSTAETTSM